ncbi:MAG: CHASE2 domain-containing protein, partial [Cyanobacteria bacterium J06635_11]
MTWKTMLGQTLAKRYKLTRILGAGGFGQTYLATDLQQQSQQHQCVVKQLKPASQDASFLSVARRLFETEVKILNELGDHAQIPHLLDSFEEDNEFYLVQEFIDGQSLEEEIKQAGKFSESEVISLLEGVLPVLEFIHDHHVVHRDLKPDNLIRRKDDGKIVLIDFGAVKEIRTRLVTGEQTALTIGIGTQGYTPSEQLSGKPRYSSDLYALGMTAIHALTGRSPTALPEDGGSLDPQWEAIAEVSPGLAIVLGKMTRHYIYQRYQDVASVRHDLSRLEALPAEAAAADTYLETSMPQQSGGQSGGEAKSRLRWRMRKRAKVITVAISTVVTSALVLGLRHVGFFVPEEVAIYDTLINIQPDKGPDPRLLLVEVTDEDLRSLSVATPSDGDVASVIETLQKHQPASIGLDLLRDVPQAPGSAQLTQSLKMPNVVATTTLGNETGAEVVLPPPGMSFSQVSFNNIVVDSDFRVRRALMLDFLDDEILASKNAQNFGQEVDRNLNANPSEDSIFSLGIELAIRYLDQYHDILPTNADVLELNGVRFETLTPTFGGYQKADTAGYQMLLQYRSAQNVATRIRFTDVLNN